MERTVFLVYTVNGQKQFDDCLGETKARGLVVSMLNEDFRDISKNVMLDKVFKKRFLIELYEAIVNDNYDDSGGSIYQTSKYMKGEIIFKREVFQE